MMYKEYLSRMLSYTSETSPLSGLDQRLSTIRIFESGILTSNYGPVEENGAGRKRYNIKLYKLFNKPDTIGSIKVKRLKWGEHIICASENRMSNVFNNKLEGTTRRKVEG